MFALYVLDALYIGNHRCLVDQREEPDDFRQAPCLCDTAVREMGRIAIKYFRDMANAECGQVFGE